jgi:demethylspheroidene O-methyltransferase
VAWSDRYLAIRDRWLASPRFQHWAAAFPLTRPTARKRARALFDVCAGFVYSQILFACVRLKLFDLLAEGPLTPAEIAARLSVPPQSTERLLEAAASLRLVEKRGAGRYGLGSLGAALVGNPAVVEMVEHNRLLYADLRDPVGLLRGERPETELGRYWAYTPPADKLPCKHAGNADQPLGADASRKADDARGVDYTTLMAKSQPLVSGEILDAYPLTRHSALLDVGGGDGSFLIEAGRRYSHLQLRLFDLPPVAGRASQRFHALGLDDRAQAIGGSFLRDALPPGCDIVSLVRVVHDHDDDAAMTLLRAVHRALPPQGTLLLAEPMMGTPGAEPVGDAYFGFYLLAMGRGRPRTPRDLKQMLESAGFARTQLLKTRQPLQSRVLVAHKRIARKSVKNN